MSKFTLKEAVKIQIKNALYTIQALEKKWDEEIDVAAMNSILADIKQAAQELEIADKIYLALERLDKLKT